MSTTPSLKPADVIRKWYVVDASEATLGRVATVVARKLIGKDKPFYTPHVDNGDYIVVVNSDKIVLTGNKAETKKYYSHSSYAGGLKTATYKQVQEKDSRRIIEHAVKGMLPKNKLQSGRMNRLKIYHGEEHEHTAQKPEKLGVS